MSKKDKKSTPKNSDTITYQLSQFPIVKYLVVIVDRGMASDVNHFNSLKEAKRAFKEIVHDHGYKPEEINSSYYYDVSIFI